VFTGRLHAQGHPEAGSVLYRTSSSRRWAVSWPRRRTARGGSPSRPSHSWRRCCRRPAGMLDVYGGQADDLAGHIIDGVRCWSTCPTERPPGASRVPSEWNRRWSFQTAASINFVGRCLITSIGCPTRSGKGSLPCSDEAWVLRLTASSSVLLRSRSSRRSPRSSRSFVSSMTRTGWTAPRRKFLVLSAAASSPHREPRQSACAA
jgi:hypothetical protein